MYILHVFHACLYKSEKDPQVIFIPSISSLDFLPVFMDLRGPLRDQQAENPRQPAFGFGHTIIRIMESNPKMDDYILIRKISGNLQYLILIKERNHLS